MFSGKRVIITGASSGLGAAMALAFASKGAKLTLAARRLDLLQEQEKIITKLYPKAEVLVQKTDVTDQKSCQNLVAQSVSHFKGLDIFVANAGQSMWSRFSDIEDPQELQDLMQLNYMGVVYGAFYALPYLRQSRGSFVAISSIQGALPVPFHSGYVASKYAVTGFIDTLRLEEPDISFLLVMPSWIAGTELRSHALAGSKEGSIVVNHHHSKSAVSASSCAEQIILALKSHKSEIYIPKKFQYIPGLRYLFRDLVDRIVLARVKKQLAKE